MSHAQVLPFEDIARKYRKAKADRAFAGRYGDDPTPDTTQQPRPAVFRGEIGRKQRESMRKQDARSGVHRNRGRGMGAGSAGGASATGVLEGARGWANAHRVAFGAILAFAFVICFAVATYPVAKDYYLSLRRYDQLLAEQQVLSERIAALQEDVAALQTDSGVENRARNELGWVKEGENAVAVHGLEEEEKQLEEVSDVDASGTVSAPRTWYSPFLDVFFGYDGV